MAARMVAVEVAAGHLTLTLTLTRTRTRTRNPNPNPYPLTPNSNPNPNPNPNQVAAGQEVAREGEESEACWVVARGDFGSVHARLPGAP